MAYMRGDWYTYRTSSAAGEEVLVCAWVTPERIPMETFDALVVMRYAQLQEEGTVEEVERQAVGFYAGNFGCDALCRKVGVPDTIQIIERITEKMSQADREAEPGGV